MWVTQAPPEALGGAEGGNGELRGQLTGAWASSDAWRSSDVDGSVHGSVHGGAHGSVHGSAVRSVQDSDGEADRSRRRGIEHSGGAADGLLSSRELAATRAAVPGFLLHSEVLLRSGRRVEVGTRPLLMRQAEALHSALLRSLAPGTVLHVLQEALQADGSVRARVSLVEPGAASRSISGSWWSPLDLASECAAVERLRLQSAAVAYSAVHSAPSYPAQQQVQRALRVPKGAMCWGAAAAATGDGGGGGGGGAGAAGGASAGAAGAGGGDGGATTATSRALPPPERLPQRADLAADLVTADLAPGSEGAALAPALTGSEDSSARPEGVQSRAAARTPFTRRAWPRAPHLRSPGTSRRRVGSSSSSSSKEDSSKRGSSSSGSSWTAEAVEREAARASAATSPLPTSGWVTLFRPDARSAVAQEQEKDDDASELDAKEVPQAGLVDHRPRLNAGERQRHMALWRQREATDRAHKNRSTSSYANGRADGKESGMLGGGATGGMAGGSRSAWPPPPHGKAGPSLAYELDADPSGIGFAFGGVQPGDCPAARRGQVHSHTVRYTIGAAGRYQLHVGLRTQAVPLPGSPFDLVVEPSDAHAPSTRLPSAALPLTGVVGESWSCTCTLRAADRMGNRCVRGGAPVVMEVHSSAAAAWHARPATDDSEATRLHGRVVDQDNGSYLLQWKGRLAGTFHTSVRIAGTHVVGSPTTVTMLAGPPDVPQCEVSGSGLSSAVAGQSTLIFIGVIRAATRRSALSPRSTLNPRGARAHARTPTESMRALYSTRMRGWCTRSRGQGGPDRWPHLCAEGPLL